VGSTVTPVGTAITFTGSASRLFTAMARKDQAPEYFDRVHPRYKVSRRSLLFNTLFAISFILIFHSWSNLAQILSLLHIVSYLTAPIAMITLRRTISRDKYKLYVPFGIALCYVIFIIFNYLISYADLNIVINLAIMLIGIQIVFIISRLAIEWECIKENMISIIKISIYIMLLPLICFLNKVVPILEFDIIVIFFSILTLFILTN
jgi:amino acid transporter